MADRTVTVRLKVSDEFSTNVDRYNQKMQTAERSTQQAAQSAQRAGGMFSGMGSALTGAVVAFGVMGTVRVAEQLYSMGMNAQRAGMLFESFGAQVGSTSALLERLRSTTRGVVDDTTLMNAANTQLSMGLAKTSDDVERLTNIGVTFAQAMGQDIGTSMENLNMLLANQSYLRLDTLGISSSQVRELAGQYRAAGMDSSEAFTAAFMDVAEAKMPQMDAVADAMVTPFQELQAGLTNFANEFGDNFAYLINEMAKGVASIAEGIAGIFGSGGAPDQATLNARATAGTYADLYTGGGNPAGMLSSSNITGAIAAAIRADQAGMDAGSAEFLNMLTTEAFGVSANDSLFNTEAGQQMLQQAAGIVGWYESYMGMVGAAQSGAIEGTAEARAARQTQFSGNAIQDIISGTTRPQWATAYGNAGMFFDQLSNMANSGGGRLFAPEEVETARQLAAEVQHAADMVDNLGLSDAIVGPMQDAAKAAGDMADNIERSNVALVSMPELFGQTSGGQFDAINQSVLNQLRENGATPDQLRAIGQRMGQQSGTMTDMSIQFENEIVPELAGVLHDLGPDWYFVLQQAYLEYVRQIRTETPEFNGAVPWDLIMRDAGINEQQGGGAYTVQAGDTVWGLAHAAGMTTQEYMAANGLDSSNLRIGQQIGSGSTYMLDPSMIGNAPDVQAATDARAQQMGDSYQYNLERGFEGAVDTFSAALETLAANAIKVPVEFVITNGGLLGQLVAAAVGANGGTVPGSSTNTGRSATGSGTRGVRTSNAIGGGV
jgi:hypothetical protein